MRALPEEYDISHFSRNGWITRLIDMTAEHINVMPIIKESENNNGSMVSYMLHRFEYHHKQLYPFFKGAESCYILSGGAMFDIKDVIATWEYSVMDWIFRFEVENNGHRQFKRGKILKTGTWDMGPYQLTATVFNGNYFMYKHIKNKFVRFYGQYEFHKETLLGIPNPYKPIPLEFTLWESDMQQMGFTIYFRKVNGRTQKGVCSSSFYEECRRDRVDALEGFSDVYMSNITYVD